MDLIIEVCVSKVLVTGTEKGDCEGLEERGKSMPSTPERLFVSVWTGENVRVDRILAEDHGWRGSVAYVFYERL